MPNSPTEPTPLRRTRVCALLTAVLAGGAVPGRAQETPPASLETVTVTGSRLGGAGAATASVVGPAAIETLNKPDVPELLASVPGLHTNQPGGRGSVGELILRGGEPNFTTVLVDGIQVNDPTNTRGGSFDLSTLALAEIERIEILRGPISSIYGSDALSGLINFVTREPTDALEGRTRIALGSEDYSSVSVHLAGPSTQAGRYALNAATHRDGRSGSDAGYRTDALSGRLVLEGRNESTLAVDVRHSRAQLHAYPDSSGGPLHAASSEQDTRLARDDTLGLSFSRALAASYRLHVSATLFEHDERVASPGVPAGVSAPLPASRSDSRYSRHALSAFVSAAPRDGLQAAFGMSFDEQAGRSDALLELAPGFELPSGYSLQRDNTALFGELVYALTESLSFGASLRLDDSDAAASETTSTLDLRYTFPRSSTRVHLTRATGFKLPSLFSLGDALVGNPALESETATSWELGVQTTAGIEGLQLRASVFAQRFENLIDFDFEQFMSVNRSRVQIDGIEIHARYRIARDLSWTLHGTWLDIDLAGSAAELRQRPRRHGRIGLEWSPGPAVTVYAGWRHVGARLDAAIPTGERRLPSYGRADASLTWHLSDTVDVELAIDNVTDERYEDAIGFPDLGRRVRIAVRAALQSAN